MKPVIDSEIIGRKIYMIRITKVMLDSDLPELHSVTTKILNEQVRRNVERFPDDFVFQLTADEFESLRSHFATSNFKHGGRRYMPHVFTEHGALMAASVINTNRAVEISIYVVRAFVKFREMIATNIDLTKKLEELEMKYDSQFSVVFDAIRELMLPPEEEKRKIGYIARESRATYITSH